MIFIYRVKGNSNDNYIHLLGIKIIDIDTFTEIKKYIKMFKNPVFYFTDLLIGIKIKDDIEFNKDIFLGAIGDENHTIENINEEQFIEEFNNILNKILKFKKSPTKSNKLKKSTK